MSEFTRGTWFSVKSEMKAGKHRRTKIYCGVSREDGTLKTIATLSGTAAEAKANARLITAAPEMYRLLNAMCEIEDQKAYASGKKNDPAFMMALAAQEDAVKTAKDLLARINGNGTEGGKSE